MQHRDGAYVRVDWSRVRLLAFNTLTAPSRVTIFGDEDSTPIVEVEDADATARIHQLVRAQPARWIQARMGVAVSDSVYVGLHHVAKIAFFNDAHDVPRPGECCGPMAILHLRVSTSGASPQVVRPAVLALLRREVETRVR